MSDPGLVPVYLTVAVRTSAGPGPAWSGCRRVRPPRWSPASTPSTASCRPPGSAARTGGPPPTDRAANCTRLYVRPLALPHGVQHGRRVPGDRQHQHRRRGRGRDGQLGWLVRVDPHRGHPAAPDARRWRVGAGGHAGAARPDDLSSVAADRQGVVDCSAVSSSRNQPLTTWMQNIGTAQDRRCLPRLLGLPTVARGRDCTLGLLYFAAVRSGAKRQSGSRNFSAGRRLDQIVDAQIHVTNPFPVGRSVGLLPVAALVDVLLRLAGMLDNPIRDTDWIAENYPGIITLGHGRQG